MGNVLFRVIRGIEFTFYWTLLLPFRAWGQMRRKTRRARALAGGYFWMQCPCWSPISKEAHFFGGHEWNPKGVMLAFGDEIIAVCNDCQRDAAQLNFTRERSNIVAPPELVDEIRRNGRVKYNAR